MGTYKWWCLMSHSPNKSIKFAHNKRGLGLGDKTRLAPYFKRYALIKHMEEKNEYK